MARTRTNDAADKAAALLRIWWTDCLHSMFPGYPEREHPVCDHRDWRFDLAWPERRVAVEVHGAVHTQGRHTRGAGFEGDRDKINTATLLGWRVLEFSTSQLFDGDNLRGEAVALIEAALGMQSVEDALVRMEAARKERKQTGDRRKAGPLFCKSKRSRKGKAKKAAKQT